MAEIPQLPNIKLYSIPCFSQATREFIAHNFISFPLDEAAQALQSNNFYNIRIETSMTTNLFGDLDHFPDPFEIFADALTRFLNTNYHTTFTETDVSYTLNSTKPYSYHFVMRQVSGTIPIIKEVMRKFTNATTIAVDTAIYSSHWFRMPNQSKGRKTETEPIEEGIHEIIRGEIADFIPQNIRNSTFILDRVEKLPILQISPSTEIIQLPSLENKHDILLEFFDKCYKPERFSEYQSWLNIGMALRNTFGDDGFELWKYCSRKSPTPDTDDQLALKWRTFKCGQRGGFTIATLYYYAREDNEKIYHSIVHKQEIDTSDYGLVCLIQKYANNRFMWIGNKLYCKNHIGYWECDKIQFGTYICSELYDILKLQVSDLRTIAGLKSSSRIDSLMKMSYFILRSPDELKLDADPYLIGFNNGVFDLRTSVLRDYCDTDYISITTGYAWREPTQGELATMNAIIAHIMPNEEQRALLLEVYASGFHGQCVEHFIVLNGNGRNGKGLLDDMVLKALGKYAMLGNHAYLITPRRMGANPEIANMDKKRFIVFREPAVKTRFANSAIKELTGGGGMPARGLYESESEKELCCTAVVECNQRPLFAEEPTDADISRIIDINFASKFTSDRTEVDISRNIYPARTEYKSTEFQQKHKYALFRIIANSFASYAARGMDFEIPQSVKNRTMEYLEMSSDLISWIHSRYETTGDQSDIVKLCDMWDLFRNDDYYNNLTKQEKKRLTRDKFYDDIANNALLRKMYRERSHELKKHLVGLKIRIA